MMHFLRTAPVLAALAATVSSAPSGAGPIPGNLSFYTPSWPDWDQYVTRWSAYEAPTFSLAFLPNSEEELSQGIAYLARRKMTYLAKGGGHGYSTTLGVDQDVVQVNMENFRNVTVHPDNTVTVGGGARMLDVVTALYNAGREVTVGSYPCVGATGAMLGGGLGRLQGLHGLMIDSLEHARIALWNGTIIEASEKVNSDLFWGLRGAGHNFGVVTESTYRTYPGQDNRHYYADMVFTSDSLEGVLNVYKGLIEEGLDAAASLALSYLYDAQSMSPLINMNVVYAHNEQNGRALSANFASTTGNATHPITRVSLDESYITFAEVPTRGSSDIICQRGHNQDIHPVTAREFFDIGAMVDLYASFGSFVREHPAANGSVLLFEAANPQTVDAVPDAATAFPLRGRYILSSVMSMTWDGDDETEAINAWATAARDTLAKPEVSGSDRLYIYMNYANGDESLSARYGYDKWRHERLTGLKQRYDPHGFFNAYHAIPLKMSGWN
ncbi:hypothetical protein GGS23DRAFT_612666 [Durotheca rogersii]|uniref:uncharacterized protein n=1 Tax=Durotheca rogersii TaxID=419775 RepID=UPI00221F0F58|nr:uncharacterized protein GGS23DRAFT_612666 [Durotheca rogersii]KAI5867524.1 hypothetical protein GGS23DRAFT_612666 [Durotheca rogersii]